MKVAKFERISETEFAKSHSKNADLDVLYGFDMPKRATTGSAGYDFYAPEDIILKPGETVTVKTCIRCRIDSGWFLAIFPRSGHGFKYKVQLYNTTGIIDSDYYNADNEGHIMVKLFNDYRLPENPTEEDIEKATLRVPAGTAFCQGIFLPYGLTVDDNSDGVRTGGFGSTSN